ncbi:MFS transporter [Actinomadura sp. J1-007]|nr:MFS transporter [Actinomadura sp. J1-007]
MLSLTTRARAEEARLSARHRLLLVLLLGAQFVLAVDFSILNVALPALGDGLGFSLGGLQWVATAFALPAAGFTLLAGRIADLFGRRLLFVTGLVLLAAGSVVGGLANGPGVLLTGRVLQGLATAVATPAALSLLTTSFPEGPLRQRALGLNGALMSAGFASGAFFGGILTELLSWRWAFLVNAPVAVVLLAATPALVRGDRRDRDVRLDIPGAVTVTAGLLALVYGVTEAGQAGWEDPTALGLVAAGLVLLGAFGAIEAKVGEPLASPRVLARRTVGWGNFGGLFVVAMQTSVIFLLTLYLQDVLGYSPFATGLVFGVPGAVAAAAGFFAPRWIGRVGAHAGLAGSLALMAAANGTLLFLGTDRMWVVLVLIAGAAGIIGNIYGIVAYTLTATSGLPDHEQGLATGLTTMTMQIGMTLGIPLISAVANARTGASRSPGAIVDGLRVAIGVDVALTCAAALLVALFLMRPAHAR